jgi:DNA-binding NarL/FixJ family response regulator
MAVTVLLADDREMIRRSIRRMLEDESRIHVVAEAESFHFAVERARSHRPQVVVMDLNMPFRNHVTARDVKSQLASLVPRLFAISFAIDADSKLLAEACGARLLLDKTLLPDQLVPAILGSAASA